VSATGDVIDPAIMGGYFVGADEKAYVNSPTNFTVSRRPSTYTYAYPRPIIKGTYNDSCRQSQAWGATANKCAWNTANTTVFATNPVALAAVPGTAVPTSLYGMLVMGEGKGQILQDFIVRDSAGNGLGMQPAPPAIPGYCLWDQRCDTYSIIQRVFADHNAENGIQVAGAHWIVRFNETRLNTLRMNDNPPWRGAYSSGAAMTATSCDPCFGLMEGNDLHDSTEELAPYGIGFILVRGNWVGSGSRVGISSSNAQSFVVEQNIVVGGKMTADKFNWGGADGPYFWPYGYENGIPTAIGTKPLYYRGDYPAAKFVRRNNVSQSVTAPCLYEYFATGASTSTKGETTDVGNTCFVTGTGTEGTSAYGIDIRSYVNWIVNKNNLYVTSSASACSGESTRNASGLVTWDYNQYTNAPSYTGCNGAHDVVGASGITSGFNWSAATWYNFPAESDFAVSSGGAGVNKGTPMTGAMFTYTDSAWGKTDNSTGMATWWSWVLSKRQWLPACNTTGAQVPEAEWHKLLTTNYCGNPRSATPNMGAF
jgi:hypothetical protein